MITTWRSLLHAGLQSIIELRKFSCPSMIPWLASTLRRFPVHLNCCGSFIMAIGTLTANVYLHSQRWVGNNHDVKGCTRLRFAPKSRKEGSVAELFGPLRITITLRGHAKTKIVTGSGNNNYTHRDTAEVLSVRSLTYEGPLRMSATQTPDYPFTIGFPWSVKQTAKYTDYRVAQGDFRTQDENVLPPTFTFSTDFDASVEYRLTARVSMAGIDVKVKLPSGFEESRVHIAPPPVLAKFAVHDKQTKTQHVKLSNKHLLPEHEWPRGFKEKTKAIFCPSYYPQYHYDVAVLASRNIYVGQPMSLKLAIRRLHNMSTAPVIPEVEILQFRLALLCRIVARTNTESASKETVTFRSGLHGDFRAFGKAEDVARKYTTAPLTAMESSFTTFNIARRYILRINLQVRAAGKLRRIEENLAVILHQAPEV